MDSPAQSGSSRLEILDAYRVFAIVSVAAYHYLFAWQHDLGQPAGNIYLKLGSFGVELFFVISGFVITMTMERSKGAFIFIYRRLTRIWPVYLFANIVIFSFLHCYDPLNLKVGLKDLLASSIFAAKELGLRNVDGAFWSLNVEVKFYFIIAFSMLLLKSRAWIGLVAFSIIGLVCSFFTSAGQKLLFLGPYCPFFLWGLALWYVFKGGSRVAAITCAATAFIGYFFNHRAYEIVGADIVTPHIVLIGAVMVLSASVLKLRSVNLGFVSKLGQSSYSYYLFHQYIGISLLSAGVSLSVPQSALVFIIVLFFFLLSTIVFALVEKPSEAFLRSVLKNFTESKNGARVA